MTLKSACLAFGTLLFSAVAAFSAEPVVGERQSFRGSDHAWKLSQGDALILHVFAGQSVAPVASYELANCMFCEGEEDNCDSDGVVEVNLTAHPGEPILAVTCHVGAHSQQFQVLAPWRNKTSPAYSVTGDFFVLHDIDAAGVSVEYDARNADGEFETLFGRWP